MKIDFHFSLCIESTKETSQQSNDNTQESRKTNVVTFFTKIIKFIERLI